MDAPNVEKRAGLFYLTKNGEKLKIEKVKIGTVKINPANPRIIKDEKFAQLVRSIRDFPEMLSIRPIVVNAKMEVLGGNMRLRACIEAGMKEVDIIRADNLTDNQQREFIIKDNVGFGEWDWEALANEWDNTELADWGLEVPEDFAGGASGTAEEDNYEVPDEIETDIVLGDLFEIGRHRLLCGDNSNIENIEILLGGGVIDAIVTDPPYGIGIDGQKKSIAKNPKHNRKGHEFRGWDSERPRKESFDLILSKAEKAVIWGGNYFADYFPHSRGWIYWSKGQDGLSMSDGELAWTTENKPLRCVVENRAVLQNSKHPTQKPVKVICFSINYMGDGCANILDPFMGSGTTMVAAHQLSRRCYGMEIDPKYCQVIVDRMIKLDPTLEIKRNGITYEIPTRCQEEIEI